MALRRMTPTTLPSVVPAMALPSASEPYMPRWWAGADSTMKTIEPTSSPPTETPCSRRMSVSSTVAQTPTCVHTQERGRGSSAP